MGIASSVQALVTAVQGVGNALGLDLSHLSTSISTETTNRTNADSSEATTRANADTSEASARASADSAEATARNNADVSLQNQINVLKADIIAPVVTDGAQGSTLSAGQTQTLTCSLTAPAAGHVFAFGSLNMSNNATASMTVNLSIAGTNVSGDSTVTSQSHFGTVPVSAGQVVQIVLTVHADGDAGNAFTARVGGFFIAA
ncbi:hypothetical protein [Burkholderia phage FLC9]|nr:hypothetical protein [Burkholderia phage FLC9]